MGEEPSVVPSRRVGAGAVGKQEFSSDEVGRIGRYLSGPFSFTCVAFVKELLDIQRK